MKKLSATRQFVTGAVSIAVSASLLTLLILKIDFERAIDMLSLAKWEWLLAAAFMVSILPFSAALRWQGVLRAYGKTRMPFGKSVRAVMMANVLNSFLPSKGGDMAKAVYLKKQAGLSVGFGTLVIERLVDLMVLGLLGAIAKLSAIPSGGRAVGGGICYCLSFFWLYFSCFPCRLFLSREKSQASIRTRNSYSEIG